jgi:hypothetical protein
MPCGISDVNLPSFLQERLGLLNTDGWSDPDCRDRLSIFGRLDRESCHLAPVLCHGPIARRRLDETAPQGGVAKQPHRRPALSYARRASPARCLTGDQRFPRGTIVLTANKRRTGVKIVRRACGYFFAILDGLLPNT